MAHPTTICLLIAIAAANSWDIKQAEVECTYLNAELPEMICLAPPKGMECEDSKVMTLKQAFYCLATFGALWHECFKDKMFKFKMTVVTDDNTVFCVMRPDSKGVQRKLVVAIVVDDCLMTGNSEELCLEWVEFMRGFFKLTCNCDLNLYLGVRYKQTASGIKASQTAYLEQCLKSFGLEDCIPADTLMDT